MATIEVAPGPSAVAPEGGDKLAIVMFSGTADKFIPLGVFAQAASAMGMQVNVFVTGFALQAFTKAHHDLPFPAEFAAMAPALGEGALHQKSPGGPISGAGADPAPEMCYWRVIPLRVAGRATRRRRGLGLCGLGSREIGSTGWPCQGSF